MVVRYETPPGAPQFHSMDWMLQSFNLNVEGQGVYHIGAHTGFDSYIYHGLGAKYIIWDECNPRLSEKLDMNVASCQLQGYDQDAGFKYAITDKDDEEVSFYFYNSEEDGTSSLFKPGGIEDKIAGTKFLGECETKVKTITLDTMIERHKLPYLDTRLMNIDVQGSELNVLKGAQKLLASQNLKYIICEISHDPLYDGGAIAFDIDQYLYQYGFVRIFFRPDCIKSHGDGIYIR